MTKFSLVTGNGRHIDDVEDDYCGRECNKFDLSDHSQPQLRLITHVLKSSFRSMLSLIHNNTRKMGSPLQLLSSLLVLNHGDQRCLEQ